MEEQLIDFQAAKLAKEKGFKIQCEKCFVLHSDSGGIIGDYNINDAYGDVEFECYQPTQSLLQRWLREKHNIEVNAHVNFYNKSAKLGYYYMIDVFDENNIHDGKDHDFEQMNLIGDAKGFDTFEQALEVALTEGLKLIKNSDDE